MGILHVHRGVNAAYYSYSETKPVFSRERFTTVTAYRGFVTKSQL